MLADQILSLIWFFQSAREKEKILDFREKRIHPGCRRERDWRWTILKTKNSLASEMQSASFPSICSWAWSAKEVVRFSSRFWTKLLLPFYLLNIRHRCHNTWFDYVFRIYKNQVLTCFLERITHFLHRDPQGFNLERRLCSLCFFMWWDGDWLLSFCLSSSCFKRSEWDTIHLNSFVLSSVNPIAPPSTFTILLFCLCAWSRFW